MRFPEKTITLKDGRNCILKPAAPDLAEELIRFLKQIAAETPFLTRYPDEVDKKAEEEAEFLNRTLENPAAAMLAGLPNAPSVYSPYENFLLAKKRQFVVLDAMVKNGMISKELAENAKIEPIYLAH